MKFILSLLILAFAFRANATDITVRVTNPPEEGQITVMVFDSANAFGDFRDPIKRQTFELASDSTYTITNLPGGEYAVVAYHDENENDALDENFIGIPAEPVGFSNGYRPKGPPSYVKATFQLNENYSAPIDMELRRALGELGQVAVGVGVIGRSSPYRDYDGGVYQFIPAITYIGDRLQIFGPAAQLGLYRNGDLNLALLGSYAIGVYEEDDSPFLEGLGDRESTFMTGLGLQYDFPAGIKSQLSYEHDVLDRIGGGRAQARLSKSFQTGLFRFTPQLGINWLSQELGQHYYGVPEDRSTESRAAYQVDNSVSISVGLGTFIETSRRTRLIFNIGSEFLSDEITDSPIVSEDYVLQGFGAFSYAF